MIHKHAVTSVPVLDTIQQRWSPRAFDGSFEVPENALVAAFEAARWAPSAANSQPARFVSARRGSELFETILAHLAASNAQWACNASVLISNIAETEKADGSELPWAVYDLGQAVAYFTIQAHADELAVHQMGGFDADGLHAALGLPASQRIISVTALGAHTDPHTVDLAPHHLEQELGERQRHDLTNFVHRA